jgi:hypothetical protein
LLLRSRLTQMFPSCSHGWIGVGVRPSDPEDAMTTPKDTLSPPTRWATAHVMSAVIPPALTSLLRAVEISAAENWRLELIDIEHIEAMWEMLDADSMAHGFVLSLRDGRRCYLQHVIAPEGDETVEDVEILPMRDERYPDLKGGGIMWCSDVDHLNRLLRS